MHAMLAAIVFPHIHPELVRIGPLAIRWFVLYGMIRFAVEFTREPDEQIGFVALGWVTSGQLLSLLMTLLGLLWCYITRLRNAANWTAASRVFLIQGI